MKNRPKRNWPSGWRNGLTLIEVIAGVVLAGTLLVAIINASSMHLRQLKLIDRKVVAAAAIDDFLNQWSRYQFSQSDLTRASKESGCVLEDESVLPSESRVKLSLSVRQVTVFENNRYEVVRVSAIAGPSHKSKAVDCWVEVLRPLTLRAQP